MTPSPNASEARSPLAVVVGASRGIGLELCRQLKQRGRDVIGTCRSPSPALQALGVRVETGVEVTSGESVAAFAGRLRDARIQELICSAGILRGDTLDDLNFDDVQAQIEANAIGPLRVVRALRRQLSSPGKIALITSRMGSIGDNSSGGEYGYRMSKAALNAAGMSLARDLREAGVAVAILHPGYVRTEMTGGGGNVTAEEAARQLVDRLDALTLQTSGTFWHANGQILPW
jgi:NAD(P)-dependent dehydrogenase (short-subunit alcohol dehydrogenase family)